MIRAPRNLVEVAVVIPFFQREPGILRRALESIVRQEVGEHVRLNIVVIDDDSPSHAEPEIASVKLPNYVRVNLLRQENRGPAGARNRGLDSLAQDTTFVAFLDSDDEWMPDHIDNALEALGEDFDFYFSDFFQLDQSVSAFSRANRVQPSEYPPLRGRQWLHIYDRNMADQIITGNIIGTSTVVIRRRTAPALRFREEFVSAGEDYLFWLDFVTQARGITFSSKCECRYGRGVNVYSGAIWATDEALDRNRFEIAYKRTILREFDLTPAQREHLVKSIERLREELVRQIIHRVRRLQPISLQRLKRHWATDTKSFLLFPLWVWRAARTDAANR